MPWFPEEFRLGDFARDLILGIYRKVITLLVLNSTGLDGPAWRGDQETVEKD
jgi:hypothetical protein